MNVPQWASRATNSLLFANQYGTATPLPVTVFFDQTAFPPPVTNPPILGPASSGTVVLTTNGVPPLVVGQPYYLAVSNPNPVGVTFSLSCHFLPQPAGTSPEGQPADAPAGDTSQGKSALVSGETRTSCHAAGSW